VYFRLERRTRVRNARFAIVLEMIFLGGSIVRREHRITA